MTAIQSSYPASSVWQVPRGRRKAHRRRAATAALTRIPVTIVWTFCEVGMGVRPWATPSVWF